MSEVLSAAYTVRAALQQAADRKMSEAWDAIKIMRSCVRTGDLSATWYWHKEAKRFLAEGKELRQIAKQH